MIWDSLSGRLMTIQLHDHQSHTVIGGVPLLVIDAWEHAWYLQYLNEKAKFFDAIWNVLNWKDVGQRFEHALTTNLALEQVAERAA